MSTSTPQTEASGHRRSKRSSYSSPASHPTWVLVNERGARGNDDSHSSDRVMSLTTTGEQIFVSFQLVEPPRISFLTVDLPQRPIPTEKILYDVTIVAAHRDVVLFKVRSSSGSHYSAPATIDYFVYKASCGSSCRPSMLLLPAQCCERRNMSIVHYPMEIILTKDSTGILSSASKEEASFIVADLSWECPESQDYHDRGRKEFYMYVLWSGSDKWTVFKNLHIRGTNGGRDLEWWCSDVVVPYRSRSLIWVDYYRGVIFADMTDEENKPDLWYVALPVDPVEGNPYNIERYGGRGYPHRSRSLCVTRHGIKFVSVDHQRSTNFGVGQWKWTHTFRITTWSLHDDGVTWIKEARLYEEDLWDMDSKNLFPHVTPAFPVVNMENPSAICFVVDEKHHSHGSSERACMVEIDMKKKVLLAVSDYSKQQQLFGVDSVKFATGLPRYILIYRIKG
ncbi:hypothetical protein EJB05_57744, partial [Eragrostis curvula]